MLLEQETQPKSSFTKMTRLGVVLAIVFVLSFVGGLFVGLRDDAHAFVNNIPLIGDGLDTTPDPTADLAAFWKAWNTLNSRFVDTTASSTIPSSKERLWGAIQGLTASYEDPYTVFMPPEEAKLFKEDISGKFIGVGMEIGIRDDQLTVVAPLKNTPAEKAGLLTGDVILTIDGNSTKGLSTDAAVKLIRGEAGTVVTFSILRDGVTSEIKVTRAEIQVPTIEASYNTKTGIFTIELYSFTANSGSLFSKALKKANEMGAEKLIVDLRGNPGGYLQSAVAISSRFLPKDEIVVTEDYDGKKSNIVHRSSGEVLIPDNMKIVVLINQGSASASEIVAGALQDHGIATLIGSTSFGKGSVQELVEVDGGSLKITVARWLTPSGHSITGNGLTPDIAVERTAEDVEKDVDPQTERAIEFLTTGK